MHSETHFESVIHLILNNIHFNQQRALALKLLGSKELHNEHFVFYKLE